MTSNLKPKSYKILTVGKFGCDRIWVFHGTRNEASIDSIMKSGFKIGGQDGHPVAVGSAHGHGVYTSTRPDDPMQYGHQTQAVILSKALPGQVGARGSSDSWKPNQDWHIFATKEQVLPCYVVRFG